MKLSAVVRGSTASPCCCSGPCRVIARSLCGTTIQAGADCGYPEFTADESGVKGEPGYQPQVDASCPPKFYKTRKVTITASSSGYSQVYMGGDPLEKATWGSTLHAELTYQKIIVDGVCREVLVNATGESTSFYKFENPPPAVENDDSCESSLALVDGAPVWTGTTTHRGPLPTPPEGVTPPWDEAVGCCDLATFNAYSRGISGIPSAPPETIVTKDKTSVTLVGSYPYTSTPIDGNGVMAEASSTVNVTEVLSDEITDGGNLASKICDEDTCNEAEADPSCRYSSTPKCGTDEENTNRDGLTYLTIGGPDSELGYWPEGCILPGGSFAAWAANSDCENPSNFHQESSLSLVLKDLVVGHRYRATLHFKRCEFAKDGEGNYMVPTCTSGVPCKTVDGATVWEDVPDQFIEFEATDWGEVLSNRLGETDIEFAICQLKDEAHAWNLRKPEGADDRTVGSTAGGFDVPEINHHYTWFDYCELTDITDEP